METVTLRTIHKYELSDWTKEEFKKARETSEKGYVDIDDIM